MKRFIGLFAATIAAVIPLSVAGASPATTKPADYQPGCESLYQAGKPAFDAFITNGKALAGPMEKAFCGENKHAG
jgi:hypothetical protein